MDLPVNIKIAKAFERQVWIDEFENTSSPYLVMTWAAIFDAFSKAIRLNSSDTSLSKRIVIPAPTGTGKTQSMCYYASQLDENVGMLIVTSFIKEADKIVGDINDYSDENKAIAFHNASKYWKRAEELKEHQVLVITHNQFVGATDRKQNEVGVDRGKIDKLYQFKEDKRRLVVIDESIETIQETNLSRDNIKALQQQVSNYKIANKGDVETNLKLDMELKVINRIDELFDKYNLLLKGNKETLINVKDISECLDGFNINLSTIKKLNNAYQFRKANKISSDNNKNAVTSILNSISHITSSKWLYYSQDVPSGNVIRTARDATPKGTTTVILDATSNIDYYYDIHPNVDLSFAKHIPFDKVRNYKNVNLYLSPEQNTGKSALVKSSNITEYAKHIYSEVDKPFSDEKIAMFTFKTLESGFKELDGELDKFLGCYDTSGFKLGHFGDLNGKNNYIDCTSLYIIGTYYKSKYVTTNIHALSSRGLACFDDSKEVKEERMRLEYSQIAAELIQAINRVSCRRVIDEKGNCTNTNIYLTISNNKELNTIIINSIEKQMPGINIIKRKWNFVLAKADKPGPKDVYVDEFTKLLSSIKSDTSYASIAKDLELSKKKGERLRGMLLNNKFSSELKKYNLEFQKKSSGYCFISTACNK